MNKQVLVKVLNSVLATSLVFSNLALPTQRINAQTEDVTIFEEDFNGFPTEKPEGWSFENNNSNYTSNASCGVSPNCLGLKKDKEFFETVSFTLESEGRLTFTAKGNGSNNVMNSILTIYGMIGDSYEELEVILFDTQDKGSIEVIVPQSVSKLKFEMSKTTGNISLDDIKLVANGEVITPEEVELEGLVLSGASKLLTDEEKQLSVEYLPENTTQKDVEFSSSDESVFTINDKGVLTGVGAGTANALVSSKVDPNIKHSLEVSVFHSLASARQLEVGTEVTVSGIVSYNDRNQTLHIQDETAGIAVYKNSLSTSVFESIKPGDRVKVTGKINQFNGLVQVVLDSADDINVVEVQVGLPEVKEVSIQELKENNYDSQYVSIKEAIFNKEAKTLTQGDDVLDIYYLPSDLTVQTNDIVNVVGTMGQYNGNVQLYGSSATFTKVNEETPEVPEVEGQITVLSESFNSYASSMPSGWTESGTSATRPSYTGASSCGESTPCVKLDTRGQMLVTPTFELISEGTLSFHVKGNGSNSVMTSVLTVEMLINDEWISIYSDAPNTTATTLHFTIPKSATQIRFVMDKKTGNVAIDDVMLVTSDEKQDYLDIIEAREVSKGEAVTVKGIVSYHDGNKTVHIQDLTGGIAIYNTKGVDISQLKPGTEVLVSGVIDIYKDLVEVIPSTNDDIEIISEGNELVAKEVTIEDLLTKNYDSQFISIAEAMYDKSTNKLVQDEVSLAIYPTTVTGDFKTGDIVNVTGTMSRYTNAQLIGPSATFTKVESADEEAPVIDHEAVLTGDVDNDLVIKANVTDNKQIKSVTLNYRVVGATDFVQVEMKEDNAVYGGTISKSKLDEAGIEYYIEATDGLNVTKTDVYTVSISTDDTTGPEIFALMPTDGSSIKEDVLPTIGAAYTDRTAIDINSVKLFLDEEDVTETAKISETEVRFDVLEALEVGTHTVKLEVSDTLGNVSTKEWTFKVVSNNKNLYFGQLHSHTNLSDGQGTIDEAYQYAKENAELDFFAVTDHSNSFDNDSQASLADGSMSSKWNTGLDAANNYNEDGEFTAIYAYEMTWSAGTGKWGHMNTFNTPGFETRTNSSMDLKNYYATLKTQSQSVSQLNHPGNTFGDFADFGYYDKEIDELVTLIEVGNGEGPVRGSGYFPSYEYYTRALDKGWHVAPTNNQDNHKGNWGNSNTARTVIEAPELTRESVYEALSERRVYATEDNNLRISYELNGNTMGSILAQQDELNFAIKVEDPDANDTIEKIEIITDGGRVAQSIANVDETTKDWNFTLDASASSTYFYVKVTQNDKDIAVTAPIWVGEKENVGISKVESSANKVIVNDEVNVETVIFNNEASNIENVEVKYYLNDETTPFATETLLSINAADQASSKANLTLTKVGKNTIQVVVSLSINGATREFTERIEVTVVNPDEVTRVMIDGSHANAYVLNGSYPGNMNYVTQILQDNGCVVTINEKEITDELLAGFDLLILTDPQSEADNQWMYTESELEAIKNFSDRGGNIIISSKADYGDKGIGNASEGNAVLEAIGATVRFNDDQVIDKEENGGQTYRLYFDDYNKESIYTRGIDFDGISAEQQVNKFSFYSGNSVLVNDETTTEVVVYGHATSESDDADKANDNTPVNKGEVVALAVETLPNGSKVVVAGVTFFSDFEMDPSSEYSNPQIMTNILHDLAPEKEKTITPIEELHVDLDGDNMPDLAGEIRTVEGIITAGNTNPFNTFFDVVYVQDETGGITIHPISNLKLEIGQRVQITGTVGAYEGDSQLAEVNEATDVKIIDSTLNPVAPKLMTTADSMLEANEGWLVQVEGEVTRIDIEKGNIFVNDGTGEARVFINGYIGSGSKQELNEWVDRIQVGDTITAVGLAAEDPEGHRIRVRNTDELVVVEQPTQPELSSEARLDKLSVNKGTLTPAFNADVYNYSVTVENNVSKINLTGSAMDKLATVSGLGNHELKVGENTLAVNVTAENGTIKTYTVKVTRLAEEIPTTPEVSSEARLESLTVNVGTLSPVFNSDTTEYTVTVGSDVKKITLGGTAIDADAKIKGLGTHSLKSGQNTITVEVKAQDGTVKTYTVTVTRLVQVVVSEAIEMQTPNADLNIKVDGDNISVSNISNEIQKV
ncbi:MAG TPA: hypothetical protein DCY20_10480, partial [Firmicutes bacterium]|nr:hypothetical protein [Bacillota bacterium]